MSAGYSTTPLIKKLRIKNSDKVILVNPPRDYFQLIDKDISGQLCDKLELPDFIHLFVANRKELFNHLDAVLKKIKPTTTIWISWYKKSNGISAGVTEDVIRKLALENGLVDVKVCALSKIWSGLKLVVPFKLR